MQWTPKFKVGYSSPNSLLTSLFLHQILSQMRAVSDPLRYCFTAIKSNSLTNLVGDRSWGEEGGPQGTVSLEGKNIFDESRSKGNVKSYDVLGINRVAAHRGCFHGSQVDLEPASLDRDYRLLPNMVNKA